MPNCLNLQQLFGKTYRITFDPSCDTRHVPRAKRDPWMMQIPCKGRGVTIYPFDAFTLAIECDYRVKATRELAALGLRLHQDGDKEKTFLFAVEQFEAVAAIAKPKKRRVLTEAQRESLAVHGFRPTIAAPDLPASRIETRPMELAQ
jgi:hypothetical protein